MEFNSSMGKSISEMLIKSEELPWVQADEGVRRKVLGFDSQLMMILVEFKKDAVGYVHQHIHRQVTYIVKGSFEVQIENDKKILSAGDCYFIPPKLNHGVVALEESLLVDVFTPFREDFINPDQIPDMVNK